MRIHGFMAGLLLCSLAQAHQPHDPIRYVAVSPNFGVDGVVLAVLDDRLYLFNSENGGRNFYNTADPLALDGVRMVAFSPAFAVDSTVFAATVADGVHVSIDGGRTWRPSSNGIDDQRITLVAVSPAFASDGLLFAATDGGRLYRSDDRGEAWTEVVPWVSGRATDIAFSPAFETDGKMFASVPGSGVALSTDAGFSWQAGNDGLTTLDVTALAVSPEFDLDGRLFAATWGAGVFVSDDGGAAWSAAIPGAGARVTDVAVAPDGSLLITETDAGVFRSTDLGASWGRISRGLPDASNQSNDHFRRLAISPALETDGTIFAATFEGLYVTRTAGNLWMEANVIPATHNRDIAASAGLAGRAAVFATTYGGGMVASLDGGATWEARNRGLRDLYPLLLAISPDFVNDATYFVGTALGVYRTQDAGATYSLFELVPGEPRLYARGIGISPDYARDQTVFAAVVSFYDKEEDGFYRSEDRGETWQRAGAGLPEHPEVLVIAPSPAFADDGHLFVALERDGVYESFDRGDTWTRVGTGLENLKLITVAVSPDFATDRTLVVGSTEGMFRSTDAGLTWERVDLSSSFQKVLDVAYSPDYVVDRTMIAAMANGGVFKSTDGGDTWRAISRGLLPNAVTCVAFSPDYADDRTMFAGSSTGVHGSTDAGNDWRRVQRVSQYEVHPDFMYLSGPWNHRNGAALNGEGEAESNAPGARLYFPFKGRRLRWLGSTGPDRGVAGVWLDGGFLQAVDLYAPVQAFSSSLFEVEGLAERWHTLTIVVTGRKNPLSSNTFVTVDAVEVED